MDPTAQTPDNMPQTIDQAAITAQLMAKIANAYATSTMRAVRSDTRIFLEWCHGAGLSRALPTDPVIVAAFVAAMSETRKPATVARYVTNIDHLHRAARLIPVGQSSEVRLALRRMRREKTTARDKAKPMRLTDIKRALSRMGDSLLALRDGALIALAYDTLCHASELVALTVGDVQADGVYIKRPNIDQDGVIAIAYISPATFEKITALVAAFHLEPTDPLFIPLGNHATGESITASEVSRIYKRRVGSVFSAHSTRVGAAVEMRKAGLSTSDIAHAGRWKRLR